MISTRALLDVAKRPMAVDERTGRHPRDPSAPPTDLRSSIRGRPRRFYIYALLNYAGNEVTLRAWHRRHGQPVVLLYGHQRTHTRWHWVVPQLARSFSVVCPDLRRYGQSTPPPDAPEHTQSSKRARTGCPLVTAACG